MYAYRRGLSVREYLRVALVRTMLTCLTPRQIVAILPSTEHTFKAWTKSVSQRLQTARCEQVFVTEAPSSIQVKNLHWIRYKHVRISKVLLFLHGGGYNAPLSAGHLEWCLRMAESSRGTLSIAILEYSLTPEFMYPTQLKEARDALSHLLHAGIRPCDIFIAGDSAGGNLALALLSLAMHPLPSVEPLHLDEPLAGVILVSPWLTDDTTTSSFERNAYIDMLSPQLVKQSAGIFLSEPIRSAELKNGQGWALPLFARSDWWNGLDSVVKAMYITVGAQEMFHDHVVEFTKTLQAGIESRHSATSVHLDVGETEAHDHVLTLAMSRTENNPSLERMITWLRGRLENP